MDNIKKFQGLLGELFQFNAADLDFGIYRIMNYKRGVIERFISEDLPKSISQELAQGSLAGQTQAAKELEDAKKKVLAISDDAIDAAGNLIKYHDTKPGKEYLAALEKAKSAKGREALEAAIYNHLYAFFSRYYQDGDFISKRRYSKRERYAIPYNGEEVTLYWANHDQYYIKTGEYFTDYTWKATGGVTVHFKLTAADVEQNNVKGAKRFFLPWLDEIAWDESAKSLTIPFEFRPLNGQEAITYGGKNQQEAIITRAVENIPKQRPVKTVPLALAALEAEKRRTADGDSVTQLEHHLRQYSRRNTSDFFIHKDLRGFLARELDFYLKNEVLNLDEMEAAGIGLSEGWFQMMRLIKKVGGHIIEFLAQIEEFQKMLWEKRKFITETFYCITVGHIPEEFYPEIAACEAQWEEWKALFSVDEGKSGKSRKDRCMEFLKAHPTLVLDTRRFSPDFTDRLLASFDDLDEATDGLLVHGENWQALNLMRARYKKGIQSVCVDPPYNTGDDGFVYKDQYQHSSWIAMMKGRFEQCNPLLRDSGVAFVHIDDNEYKHLWFTLAQVFDIKNYLGSMVWKRRSSSAMSTHPLSLDHEYVLVFGSDAASSTLYGLTKTEEAYPYVDEKTGKRYASTDLTIGMTREQRPNQFFPIINPRTGKIYQPNPHRVWRFYPDTMDEVIATDLVIWPDEAEGNIERPRYKTYFEPSEMKVKPCSSWIENSNVNDREIAEEDSDYEIAILQSGMNSEGGRLVERMFGSKAFVYPKPVSLLRSLVRASTRDDDLVLDFFAGSGTTGHAVISLNREDGGRRKFILVEMAQYFDTVLLPRIKKVTFSPEWKDGKPKRMATAEEAERGPRIVKVIRLESYEDALNNIAFDEPSGQQAMQFEDYLLQYMLQWETRKSETLLNVEKLANPFSYKLHIHRDGETRAQAVDMPETFAYLLGLYVQKRQALNDNDRRYLVYRGATREGRKVAVIWRETEGWKEKDYKRDKEFVAAQKLTEGVDEVYVNGDSYIPGAQALEKLFKERMFAPVEV
ncbi:MAG: site-specific DNA-methyltransferase [Syntrophales bacterium]|nr:site-specific DNA-methyltransferase [Syntrophales bacterium]